MVDAADRDKIEASRNELHNLLDKPQLQGIPVSNITSNTIKCLWGMCITWATLKSALNSEL